MATTILVENHQSALLNCPEAVYSKIYKALRFRDRGYFHSVLYKRKLWDGYVEFMKKDNGKFLTGLLPEIEAALKMLDVDYQLVDNRTSVNFLYKNIDANFLKQWQKPGEEPIELYDYQVDLVNQALEHKRGIIQAPTSAGKTNIMISILKALPSNCPTLILANRKSLVEQNYEEMQKWGFPNIGRLYDKYNEPNMFTCATVQSIKKIEKVLPKIKALIVDEIHEMTSKGPKKAYNKMKDCSVRIAVSATPFKFGGQDKVQKYTVKGYFGPVFTTEAAEGGALTTKNLQERKILSGSKSIFFPVREPDLQYEVYQDAITYGIARNFHLHKMVQKLVSIISGRTLILVERIEHGDMLSDLIPQASWVKGEDNSSTRKLVIDQLKHSESAIGIATSGIFNTGLNVFVHNLVNCASGQAEHMIVQRMGRGLRTAKDKEICNYYDFLFHNNEYLYKHSMKRIKILQKEGHEVEIKEFDLWATEN